MHSLTNQNKNSQNKPKKQQQQKEVRAGQAEDGREWKECVP